MHPSADDAATTQAAAPPDRAAPPARTVLTALHDLHVALLPPPPDASVGEAATGVWRWEVRRRVGALRDALAEEVLAGAADPAEGWLAPRSTAVGRERTRLVTRAGALAPQVLTEPDVHAVRREAGRLVVDVHHHLQRERDLAWDAVEAELGGSE